MFRAYGENAFTFLFFQKLVESKKITKFLNNLRSFSKVDIKLLNKELNDNQSKEPIVWLFPNFGKSKGFGEPDALILHGELSFWIEVETRFDLVKKRSDAKKALNQLLRFYYFNRALATGKKPNDLDGESSKKPNDLDGESSWVIKGPTISGKGVPKDGELRVKGHKVLQKFLGQMIESAKKQNDHYILLSIGKMKLDDKLNDTFNACIPKNEVFKNLKPSSNRFWYQYYEGDLKNKMQIDLPEYVSKKSS